MTKFKLSTLSLSLIIFGNLAFASSESFQDPDITGNINLEIWGFMDDSDCERAALLNSIESSIADRICTIETIINNENLIPLAMKPIAEIIVGNLRSKNQDGSEEVITQLREQDHETVEKLSTLFSLLFEAICDDKETLSDNAYDAIVSFVMS